MCVMAEMTVMYHDHYFIGGKMRNSGTKRSFEGFCAKISRYMSESTYDGKKVSEKEETMFLSWVMTDLASEYGLSSELSYIVVLDFFTERYYLDIYTIQRRLNNYLFPLGYYKSND